MVSAEPRLLAHLTDLDQMRLHAIALYLAYRDDEALGSQDAAFLACARSRDIVEKATGGSPPRHLLGLLRRLPACALERDLYKRLVAIAADEEFTRVLMRQSLLSGTEIAKLTHVPSLLCSAALLSAVHVDVFRLAAIAEICGWLERKWNIEAASHYLKARNLSQVRQVTLDLMRALPPVPPFPPRSVGAARIIETAEDLRLGAQHPRAHSQSCCVLRLAR
jgi:hypothetical protein